MRRALALLLVAAGLVVPATAAGADCRPRTSLGAVESEVMCPVCGVPLGLATEAPQANRQRAFIRDLVNECLTKDQIKDRLVAEYGSEVLAEPGDSGFDLAATLVPALAVLLGGGALAAAALQWRRARRRLPGPGAEPVGGGTDSAVSRRLQDDLDRFGL